MDCQKLNTPPSRVIGYLVSGSATTFAVEGIPDDVRAALEFCRRDGEATPVTHPLVAGDGVATVSLDATQVDALLDAGIDTVQVVVGEGVDRQIVAAGHVWARTGTTGECSTRQIVARLVVGPRGERGEKGNPGERGPKGERGPVGMSGDRLIPIAADITTPPGVEVGQLAGYLATAEGLTVDGVQVPTVGPVVCWWDGAVWNPLVGGAAGPSEPPEWPDGAAATTGEPTHDTVTVTLSVKPPPGFLQYRLGDTDQWRSIPAGQTLTIRGLAPSTSYAAPQIRVINAAGESSVLTARPFTTTARPRQWTDVWRSDFTAPDGTLLAEHQPRIGQPARVGTSGRAVITDGKTQIQYISANYPNMHAMIPLTSGQLRVRTEFDYEGALGATTLCRVQFNATSGAWLRLWWAADQIGTETWAMETSGIDTLPPPAGHAVVEMVDDMLTLTIDGQLYRRWQITWPSNYGRTSALSEIWIGLGGQDIHARNPTSSIRIDNLSIQEWL